MPGDSHPGTDTRRETGASHAARVGPRLLLYKSLLLVALALVGALLARLPGVREWLAPAGRLAPLLDRLGWTAAPLFILGSMILITLGVPRLLLCPLAGAAFGFAGGMATITAATMAAYALTFLFIRGCLADRETPYPLPPSLAFLRHDPGLPGVIVTRLIPVPGLIGTMALSLSPVRWRDYLTGSFIGLLPEAVPLVLLGAGLLEGSPKQLAWLGAGALALILACYVMMRRLARRHGVPQPNP